jgi:hypothetical protein
MTSRGCTRDRYETREQQACWKEGVALIGRIDMRKTVHEISKDYGIPPATLRSAIFRGKLLAEKVGGIRMIDDEGSSFRHYLLTYAPRRDDLFDDPLLLEQGATSSMHKKTEAAHQRASTP